MASVPKHIEFPTNHTAKNKERLPTHGPISFPGLYRWFTTNDGSCLIHAILNAMFLPYQQGKLNGEILNRPQFVREIRKQLAEKLGQPVSRGSSTNHYQELARGGLPDYALSRPEYSLPKLQSILDSTQFIGHTFLEFISNHFEIDIFIINLADMDIYLDPSLDDELLYKGRSAVVVGFIKNHYETIAIEEKNGEWSSYFDTNSAFIRQLWERKETILKERDE